MDFNKDNLETLIDTICNSNNIKLADIPDIDLYMEQLLSYLNPKLDSLGHSDKALTKTMINNYSKAGVLPQPRNKKYTKKHVISLILIYQLKNILSLNDIRNLFGPILNDINDPTDDVLQLEKIFNVFSLLKNDQYGKLCHHFNDNLKLIQAETTDISNEANRNTANVFLLVLMLVAQANASKVLAEKIIDDYFTPPDEKHETDQL